MKLMLVCTSGGHFSTMKRLKSFWEQHERIWITDLKQDTKELKGKEQVHWLPYQGPRNFIKLVINIPKIFRILAKERPDLIISTGASIAVGFAWLAKLFGVRFIFIESISRSTELSLSGKLIYPVCDEIYVQWPELSQRYAKTVFKGYVS
ncbi:MAG: UDP-N-acetylglucosamine--LPS N-acetylglucosamine transferase [Moorea sp. SIO1G6]|nr:UDP-N-acetylglucosamine--LPS N-acetylglucosamine transferase [Moorena sp. SIO1G6]